MKNIPAFYLIFALVISICLNLYFLLQSGPSKDEQKQTSHVKATTAEKQNTEKILTTDPSYEVTQSVPITESDKTKVEDMTNELDSSEQIPQHLEYMQQKFDTGYRGLFDSEDGISEWGNDAESFFSDNLYGDEIYSKAEIKEVTCKESTCKISFKPYTSDQNEYKEIVDSIGKIHLGNAANLPDQLKGMSAFLMQEPDNEYVEIYFKQSGEIPSFNMSKFNVDLGGVLNQQM